jgi:hypothetical protein
MRYALQAVGRRVEIIELGDWREHTPQSRLVGIGSSFEAQDLSRRFDAWLAHLRNSQMNNHSDHRGPLWLFQ